MKRFIGVLLCLISVLAIVGCSAQNRWNEQYDLGIRYFNEGNYEEAIIAFTAAIDIDSENPAAYLGRANAYIKSDKEEKFTYAKTDFETVIRMDETISEAYIGLADIFIAENNIEKAIEVLESAVDKVQVEADDLYKDKTVVLYTPDEKKTVNLKDVKAYLDNGWYTEPVVTMYAADGRTLTVSESEIEDYKNVGWYTEPVVTMYAVDGRTQIVPTADVEVQKSVGWYLPYDLDEHDKSVIRAMLYGIGEKPVGEILRLSDTFLAESVLEIAQAEYNAYEAADMVEYEHHTAIYFISEQEMQTAMHYMYGRELRSHIVCQSSLPITLLTDREYVCYEPNGRGKYGEIKIQSALKDGESFIVIYSYCHYDTAEHSTERLADSSVDLIARFCCNQNDAYPFQLLSINAPDGTLTHNTRIYPDTAVKQMILDNYFVEYSPQSYGGTRYNFNDNGTVEIFDVSLDAAMSRYSGRKMGTYSILDNNDITIKVFDSTSQQYIELCTIRYCEEQNYFYSYEFTQYKEVYCPEPYVYLPTDPNDKGETLRFKVFTYADAPSLDEIAQNYDKKVILVS